MPDARPGRRLAAALALLAALAAAAVARTAPTAPRGTDAPVSEFSAGRALEHVRALAGGGAPRPVGSPADARAVEAIAARLRALGLDTDVQRTFACGPYGACAPIVNVVARLGPPGRKGVLLVAHHDSVGAGPGAADDASGVAVVLEVARALAAGAPPARPFVALLTDAEESGLVGASAFGGHPWARDVGAAVNLEARGTSGPSILFDTSGEPAWLARALRRMPHPLTTSLAPAVYDLLPNDTDLTVLGARGLPGANLAFAADVARYHTPLDDVAHLDPASLQHQGEGALAMVRAVAEEDLDAARSAPSVYFDVFGLAVVAWRRPLLAAALAALAVALAVWRLLRRDPRPWRALLLGHAAATAAPLAAAGLLLLAFLALRHGALPRLFVAFPAPFSGAGWAAGAGAALLAGAAGRRAGAAGLLAGAAVLHALLGLALAVALPGASYVGVVPAFAAAVAAAGWAAAGSRGWILAAAAPAVAGAIVLFPIALLLPDLLGARAAVGVAGLVSLVALAAAPFVAALPGRLRFAPGAAALAAVFVLCGVQAALPHATEERPERASLVFHEQEGTARWLAEVDRDALPAALGAAAAFAPEREPALPWAPQRAAFAAPAPTLGLPPPRLEPLEASAEAGVRRVRARLVSPRGAPVLLLVLPPDAEVVSIAMEGVVVPEPAPKARRLRSGSRTYVCSAPPAAGVEIEVRLRGETPVPVVVADQSPGLPPEGARLVAARPATAVPSGDGDVTLVSAPARL
jgi:hypothetical protein